MRTLRALAMGQAPGGDLVFGGRSVGRGAAETVRRGRGQGPS